MRYAFEHREEHLRRFSEVLNILLDMGEIVIVTALEITQKELNLIKEATFCDNVFVVWVGKKKTTDIATDFQLKKYNKGKESVKHIQMLLLSKNIIKREYE